MRSAAELELTTNNLRHATAAFRRADAGRSDSGDSDELRSVLQARLRLTAWIFAAYMLAAASTAIWLPSMRTISMATPFAASSFGVYLVFAGALALTAHSLASTRQVALGWLRVVELALFGAIAVLTIRLNLWDLTTLNVAYPLAPVDITLGRTIYWVVIVTAYGVLIPNTARRTALALLLIWIASFASDVVGLMQGTFPEQFAALALSVRATVLTIACVLVWYGSYRYEVVARREAEARALGQYVLGERIGVGGMGEVYRGEHRMLRRPVAIKLITPEQAGSPDAISRFEREAQATAQLTHPNTVQVFDYGRADDGTFYCVMEYLPGRTLEQVVATEGPLSPERAVAVLTQVSGALAEAHKAGLVHRDIKPSNVMLTERGGVHDVAKLLDFGLVVSRQPVGDGRLTEAGMFVGTPEYMSPEQCAGTDGSVGPASDIYSLGALGYFLLTGASPFAGRSAVQMLAAHVYEMPPAPSVKNPAISSALDATILRALAKNPTERFADAMSFAQALAAAVSQRV